MKETAGAQKARKLAEMEDKGYDLNQAQKDAARAHRNAESAKRNKGQG